MNTSFVNEIVNNTPFVSEILSSTLFINEAIHGVFHAKDRETPEALFFPTPVQQKNYYATIELTLWSAGLGRKQ